MNRRKTLVLVFGVLGSSFGLLAVNGVIRLDKNYPTNRVSGTSSYTRWEPSGAAGSTWFHTWLEFVGSSINSYSSTWSGTGWRSPVALTAGNGDTTNDVNINWDSYRSRFVLAALDTTANGNSNPHDVWYAYSTDANGSAWTGWVDPFVAGTVPAGAPAGCGGANWDYPSIGVDASGRVIIGAVYFSSSNGYECGFWTVESSNGTSFTSPHLVGTVPSSCLVSYPSIPTGACGPQSRAVATNNLFHAFVPTLNSTFLPTLIRRWQSSDGVSWGNVPYSIGVGSFAAPWNNTPDGTSSTIIFYAPLLAAQGYTNGLWTVAFRAMNNNYNNIIICTSDRGCGWGNAYADDQLLVGTSVSGDSAYWVNYFTYQSPRNPPLMMQALYFPHGQSGIGATTSSNLQVTSWLYTTSLETPRCRSTTNGQVESCYAMGDFNTIGSNSYAAASTPFVCSNTSSPPCNTPKALYQDFVEDPQGPSDLVNFTPNYVPIPFGADVTSVGNRTPGQGSYAPPPIQMIGPPMQ